MINRSNFNLSNHKLLTCDMGELVPIGLQEVVPGDTFKQSTSLLVRVSPLLAPVMHQVEAVIHHWFVPHRIIWDDWEDFITGGPDGLDASVFPTITSPAVTGFAVGTLGDYLGCPTAVPNMPVSALPFRAFSKIVNDWYRDPDLVTERPISTASGPDSTTATAMFNAAWEKDYFTTARPWPQKGPEVVIPFGASAPVTGTIPARDLQARTGANGTGTNVSASLQQATYWGDTGGNSPRYIHAPAQTISAGALLADLSDATAINVVQLREAMAIQRFQERMARTGSRYVEYLRSLGIRPSDARLQRAEYLGGGKQTLQFSEVLQTGPDTDGDGVATLRGHGIGAMRSNSYIKFFEEHGYIISVMAVRPRTMYVQGLPRTWNRRTKEDFFQYELQHVGQQEILKKEIYAASANPDDTWAYQNRYDEYRRTESTIAGSFRDTLDFWHYARIFTSEPTLNGSFVTAVPTKRVNAVPSEDCLWIMANHRISARRMIAASPKSWIF